MEKEGKQVDYFIAPSAVVVGDVTIEKDASIWFQSVIRADVAPVVIKARTNIQDSTVIHVGHGQPTIVEEDVTVGHQCMLHGCHIKQGALIGMSSIILDGASIGEDSLIGAGSLVTKGTVIPPRSLAFGRPAKVIRTLTPEEIQANHDNTTHYVELAKEFQAGHYPLH